MMMMVVVKREGKKWKKRLIGVGANRKGKEMFSLVLLNSFSSTSMESERKGKVIKRAKEKKGNDERNQEERIELN